MNILLINNTELIDNNTAEISGERLRYVRQWHDLKDGIKISAGILGQKLCSAIIEDQTDKIILKLSDFKDSAAILPIKLIVGISRPPTMQKVITLAATFGIAELILLNTENTVKSYLMSKILQEENQHEFIFKGLEQSGAVFAPKIKVVRNFLDIGIYLNEQGNFFADTITKSKLKIEPMDKAVLIVGPEKGFTDRERGYLELKKVASFSLGNRMLRVEQAVAAGLGQFLLNF